MLDAKVALGESMEVMLVKNGDPIKETTVSSQVWRQCLTKVVQKANMTPR